MVRSRQTLGKYRLGKRLAAGSFADVYEARDTIEGLRVALKVPAPHLLTREGLADFRREVRLTARLDHPNILSIKNADFIGDVFVIAYPLGERSLQDRLRNRISKERALDYGSQILSGLEHAHAKSLIHCDVKPDNVILFPGGKARLTDFGIAKVAQRTMRASGSGTVGYVAPEQAMGHPSFRSDVFSAGLVLYRMLSGVLPEWPYRWPLYGIDRLRRSVHPDLIEFLHKCLELDPYRRFEDARAMARAFRSLLRRALRPSRPVAKNGRTARSGTQAGLDWRAIQRRQFVREHGRELAIDRVCARCDGPLAEAMVACPWCGSSKPRQSAETKLPAACPRCRRGIKLDWRYCAWCYGPSIGPLSDRSYSDKRYSASCARPGCRHPLMPFMRYCPGCHAKIRRRWPIAGAGERCSGCGWDVLGEFWKSCPWCARALTASTARGKRR